MSGGMSYRKLHENDILLSFNSVLEEEVQKSYTKQHTHNTLLMSA